MTSTNVKIIEFYAQVKHAPPQVGVLLPYKREKFYVDIKLEEPATIEDVVCYIVRRLETTTKRNIKTKRIDCTTNVSFVDYVIEEECLDKGQTYDSCLKSEYIQQITRRTLLYIASDTKPSDYYRIEGCPSYETVNLLVNMIREQGIKEAEKELNTKVKLELKPEADTTKNKGYKKNGDSKKGSMKKGKK